MFGLLMDNKNLLDLETQINTELESLNEEEKRAVGSEKVVLLDPQSVGRLSRMDALQMQAMARAQKDRRNFRKIALKKSLERIKLNEYGLCIVCEEEINIKRLKVNPTVLQCIDCTN